MSSNNNDSNILYPKKTSIKKYYKKTKIKIGSGLNGDVYLWKRLSNNYYYAIKVNHIKLIK